MTNGNSVPIADVGVLTKRPFSGGIRTQRVLYRPELEDVNGRNVPAGISDASDELGAIQFI